MSHSDKTRLSSKGVAASFCSCRAQTLSMLCPHIFSLYSPETSEWLTTVEFFQKAQGSINISVKGSLVQC